MPSRRCPMVMPRNRMSKRGYSPSFDNSLLESGAIPMKIKSLLAAVSLIAAGTAFAHDGGGDRNERNVLFKFDGGTGVQPFRSGAGGVPALNVVAGVNPGGAPWGLTSFEATIKTTGEIRARGTGVLLLGA